MLKMMLLAAAGKKIRKRGGVDIDAEYIVFFFIIIIAISFIMVFAKSAIDNNEGKAVSIGTESYVLENMEETKTCHRRHHKRKVHIVHYIYLRNSETKDLYRCIVDKEFYDNIAEKYKIGEVIDVDVREVRPKIFPSYTLTYIDDTCVYGSVITEET